jgi:hypothetical protein
MSGGVDGLELLDGNERVDLRGLGVGVAEHLLDEAVEAPHDADHHFLVATLAAEAAEDEEG